MRAAPALAVRVERFGVWHAMLGGLLATSLLALALWWAQGEDRPLLASALAAAAALVAIAAAASCWRIAACQLRWDGAQWHVEVPGADAPSTSSGPLTVAIDLGGWMLLRVTPGTGSPRWLPVQRHGLGAQWHALRCAVYSARPELPAARADTPE